jgi:hypothetical protein
LGDKLRKLGKQTKHSSPNELQLKFKALKELSSETIQTIKELELKIPSSYNFSHLTETLERSKRELENILERETNFEPTPQDKARKYEPLQTQEEYIRVIQHVQQSAREYFLM